MTDENKAKVSYRLPQKVVDILKTKPNQSAYLENLITNYENGLIVDKSVRETNKEIDLDIKRARLKNLQLDAAIKQQKLNYIETFGSFPSRDATLAIVNGAKQKQVFANDKAEPQVSESQWSAIIQAMTRQERGLYFCTVANCTHGCQKLETAQKHIADNHEELLQESLRVLK